jgi:hypothetical protein
MRKPYPHSSVNTIFTDHKNDLEVFEGKSFYCGNSNITSDNPNCCFNHIIGLPVKNGVEHPVYDYELNVVKAIEQHRNIWIKKASGIGMTELILRFLT